MSKKTEDIILDAIICRSLEETTNCPSGEYITTGVSPKYLDNLISSR